MSDNISCWNQRFVTVKYFPIKFICSFSLLVQYQNKNVWKFIQGHEGSKKNLLRCESNIVDISEKKSVAHLLKSCCKLTLVKNVHKYLGMYVLFIICVPISYSLAWIFYVSDGHRQIPSGKSVSDGIWPMSDGIWEFFWHIKFPSIFIENT